jgi:lysophospholipase L1-like esterase
VGLLDAVACDKLGLGDNKNPLLPSPPAAGSTIVYAAVGASDATGHGASVECDPFDPVCPNGTGYVSVTARQLRSQGFTVTLSNLGIPTAVIGPDFQALSAQYRPNAPVYANFIEQEMPFVLRDATLVTVFAGGNEVNTITAALGAGAGAADQAGYIDQQVKAFGADYTTLLNGIKGRANARIVVLNLPNLAGLPYLTRASLPQRQAAQRAAVGMTTTAINPLTAQNVTIVDLMCDARAYLASNYSSDGFHPNDSGYAFIAAEIVRATTSAAYPAPKNSCAQMTLVP